MLLQCLRRGHLGRQGLDVLGKRHLDELQDRRRNRHLVLQNRHLVGVGHLGAVPQFVERRPVGVGHPGAADAHPVGVVGPCPGRTKTDCYLVLPSGEEYPCPGWKRKGCCLVLEFPAAG